MIVIQNLYKSFKRGSLSNEVLKNLNITIERNQMTAIMGRSGAGKTTLLNILCGLCSMDSGTYYFQGKKVDLSSRTKADHFRNKHFGIITQKPNLLNDYTVFENIALPLQYKQLSEAKVKEAVLKVADQLNIQAQLQQYPTELSGGQQQRVAIARVLCQNPTVILADEPTGALDTKAEMEIMQLFQKLNRTGKTIIIVTHSDFIANFCDAVIMIEEGTAFRK